MNVTEPSVSTVSKCGINYLKFSGGGPYARYGTEKSCIVKTFTMSDYIIVS